MKTNHSKNNHNNGSDFQSEWPGFDQEYRSGNPLYFDPGVISIIVPCYNEAENIYMFLDELIKVEVSPYRKEIIIVNDGSEDGSAAMLQEQCNHIADFNVLHFPRNFGQQQALMAGINHARGEILVTIDMDLQQPPSLIPEMIAKYEQGYQVVHAIPEYQQSATFFKMATSKLYYRLLSLLGRDRVVYKSNEFRLFSHRIAGVLRTLPESSLYLRGIIMWLCPLDNKVSLDSSTEILLWRSTILNYKHRSRKLGRTKFLTYRMIDLAFDGLTSSSLKPLRLGLILGGVAVILAGALGFWALYMKLFTQQTVSGWTSIMVALLFFFSIQFILLGLIGEYIGKIFNQVRGRPGHIIQKWNKRTIEKIYSNPNQLQRN